MSAIASEPWTEADPKFEAGASRIARARLKRLVDLVGATAGLIVLAPFLFLVGVAIWLENPGAIFFEQRRTGYGGKPFVIYKFRTMRVREDGPTIVQAVRDDERITRVGLLLRRTSVDELPQLLNVLKGEMSLVGPRPHALAHDDYYGRVVPRYGCRFRTRPGITGLAQVCGFRGQTADDGAMAERVAKDLDYIRNWSFVLDVQILLRTVLIFAFHPAAY
ncbi:MAG: sugar transferase [Caulobacteraceae bacterium]